MELARVDCASALNTLVNFSIDGCLCRDVAPKVWKGLIVLRYLIVVLYCQGAVICSEDKLAMAFVLQICVISHASVNKSSVPCSISALCSSVTEVG